MKLMRFSTIVSRLFTTIISTYVIILIRYSPVFTENTKTQVSYRYHYKYARVFHRRKTPLSFCTACHHGGKINFFTFINSVLKAYFTKTIIVRPILFVIIIPYTRLFIKARWRYAKAFSLRQMMRS